MLVSKPNNVSVYNLSSGKSLPEWISDRKKRQLLKKDVDLRRRIELIQDFDMPTASSCVRVSPDGQYLLTSGVYKPRIKCFDVQQLSLKFDRCFDSECVKFDFLSDDFSKLVLLQSDRYVEFHAQYGRYYRTRMPRFGRDLVYHKPSCDLYLVGDGADIFRLNLEQGRFMQPYTTQSKEINVCKINEEHQLLSVGTVDGKVVCVDPRSRSIVGTLDITDHKVFQGLDTTPEVTALQFNGALEMGVGTSTGHVMLYDIRSTRPRIVKNHYYELPIKNIHFHQHNNRIVTADTKIIKIWDYETGDNFTSIEPGVTINDICVYQDSGLIFLANEAQKNSVYYIPALGQAPRWCSFLDNITEELEESNEIIVYDDYKFVTNNELDDLGLAHLRGTNVLRAYMHGFFLDMRLYHKAKSIVEPFAYEEYRKNKIKEKIEEERASRIKMSKIPKVNKQLAEKLIEAKTKKNGEMEDEGIKNPLGDDRFASMFTNKDFQVDMESEEYRLLHPVVSKQDKAARRKQEASEDEASDSGSDDDHELWEQIKMTKRKERNALKASANATGGVGKEKVKMYSLKEGVDDKMNGRAVEGKRNKALGELLKEDTGRNIVEETGTALGSREITFTLEKEKRNFKHEEALKAHKKERKKLRRPMGQLLAVEKKKPVFWRGKKV